MAGLKMKYFVLKPEGNDIYAEASRMAMREYANTIAKDNIEFATEIQEWVTAIDYEREQANELLPDVVFSEAELKAKLERQKDEIRQWLEGEGYELLAERL